MSILNENKKSQHVFGNDRIPIITREIEFKSLICNKI